MATRAAQGVTGRLLVLASAVSFGTIGTFVKLVYAHGGDPLTLLFVRFSAAFAVLAALVVAGARYPPRRVVAGGVLLGLIFYVGQSLSFVEGLEHAPAGLVVLLFYVWPLFVTLGGAAIFHERLGGRRLAILGVGLCGVALAVGVPRQSTALGVALGVAAGLFYSGYLLGGKGLLARGMTAYQLTAAAFLGPALVYAAAVGVQGFRPPSGAVGWSSLAGVVVLGTIVPTLLLFSGMRLIDAGTTSMLSTVEPLVGVILAYAVLGESLSALQLLGGGLVVSAVATLSLPRFAAAPTSAQLQREEGDTVAAPAPLAVTTSAGGAGDCGEVGGARVRAAPE